MRQRGIPQDTQWNDIDYMSAHLDFTYNTTSFDTLPAMVTDLKAHNQHYVMIVDPGISNSQTPGSYPPWDLVCIFLLLVYEYISVVCCMSKRCYMQSMSFHHMSLTLTLSHRISRVLSIGKSFMGFICIYSKDSVYVHFDIQIVILCGVLFTYFFSQGQQADIFIKNASGQILIGNVWPGDTAFPDFLNPSTTQYWADQITVIPLSFSWVIFREVLLLLPIISSAFTTR